MSQPASESASAGFDPTTDVFVAMHARPACLDSVDPARLSPFQRALLTIDGTVTQFIAAYVMDTIVVRVIDQRPICAGEAAPWLNCTDNEEVLHRRVVLVGTRTAEVYAYADSLLVTGRLPEGMRAALDEESCGLGKVLLNAALESRREALWFGSQTLGDLPVDVCDGGTLQVLTRTYRLIAGGEPLMLITEHFPMAMATPSGDDR